jgi:hypothetical protein
MTDDLNPLRIVIQQLGVSAVPGYRVIVYGDEFKPRHSDFSSPGAPLEALEAAIPETDVSQLRLNPLQGARVHRLRWRAAPQREATIRTWAESDFVRPGPETDRVQDSLMSLLFGLSDL